jgi:Bax protein
VKDKDTKIDVISFFTAIVIVMSLLFFCPSSHAVQIKTNSKPLFVYSLNSCIEDLNKTTPAELQIPSELIVAQAIIETGWGKSRFANEANNLFGIHSGLKEFKTKCDSVADYIRIINEVPAYAEFREMRQDGITDALLLARTLKRWAEDPNYTDLIEDVIQYNIRGVYEL